MGKPYSLDLRKRVVAAIEGGMSRNRPAKQFGVAISTAIGWMQRVEGTGSVAPGQMGGHKPKAISGEHAAWLSQRIKDDDTLAIARHHQTGAVIAKRFGSVRVPDHARKTLNIRRKPRRHVPRFCQTH